MPEHWPGETTASTWSWEDEPWRQAVFRLYVQIGRSAENNSNPAPPNYQQIGAHALNYYWWLAGRMAAQDPALLTLLESGLLETIAWHRDHVQQQSEGELPSF